MKNLKHLFLVVLFALSACSTLSPTARDIAKNLGNHYQYVNPEKVLFGIEYSFQDETIVAEPGRMTMRTPHKAEKFELMFENFLRLNNLNREGIIVRDTSQGNFKPGYVFNMPQDGHYTINMEPVTVEFNTTPKTVFEIVDSSSKIFEAAAMADLKPYVNPAAERSGMGHIHVGGRTLGENPFYKNPNLLRNIMVFYHKHPSLLYGFAEAYDIGDNSNIETFHSKSRQDAFQKAIAEFDAWYAKALKGEENITDGLQTFIRLITENEPGYSQLLHHYRFINLEHMKQFGHVKTNPDLKGKITVEFRTFRPEKSALHAMANAEMLLDIMEAMSAPGYLEPFEYVSEANFKNFWSAGKIKGDWEWVRKRIRHDNNLSDEMLQEAVDALESKASGELLSNGDIKAKIYHAYSKKTDKGKAYELRVQTSDGKAPPMTRLNGKTLEYEPIQIEGQKYWITYVNSEEYGVTPESLFTKGTISFVMPAKGKDLNCFQLIQAIQN